MSVALSAEYELERETGLEPAASILEGPLSGVAPVSWTVMPQPAATAGLER